jgi:putative transposase
MYLDRAVHKHNKWYANLTAELPDAELIPGDLDKGAGVGLGLLHFYALSDGATVDTPKFLRKSEKKLGKLQRKLSRRKKVSKNRRKSKNKVAKCHEKIANQRKDFLHKKSYNLGYRS